MGSCRLVKSGTFSPSRERERRYAEHRNREHELERARAHRLGIFEANTYVLQAGGHRDDGDEDLGGDAEKDGSEDAAEDSGDDYELIDGESNEGNIYDYHDTKTEDFYDLGSFEYNYALDQLLWPGDDSTLERLAELFKIPSFRFRQIISQEGLFGLINCHQDLTTCILYSLKQGHGHQFSKLETIVDYYTSRCWAEKAGDCGEDGGTETMEQDEDEGECSDIEVDEDESEDDGEDNCADGIWEMFDVIDPELACAWVLYNDTLVNGQCGWPIQLEDGETVYEPFELDIEYLPDFAQGFARRLETALQQL